MHKIVILLWACLALSGCQTPATRAVWIWEDTSYRMLEEPRTARDNMAFLASANINTVYLYADQFGKKNILTQKPEAYSTLLTELHAQGFTVHALLGSAHLQTQEYVLPARRKAAMRMVQAVFAYNHGRPPDQCFDGIHLDIEPYLLPSWSDHKPALARQYLDLSQAFLDRRNRDGRTITLEAAMPFWYDSITNVVWQGQSKPLNEHVQDLYDTVVIMDYRDRAEGKDGMIRHAQNELVYADRIGRRVVIGVETGRTEPSKVTFYEEGRVAMETELAFAARPFAAHPSFAGFAIHHFDSYRDLAGRQTTEDRP